MKRIIGGIATTSLVVATTILATTTAAHAASISGSCSVGNGWSASGGFNYTNSGTNHSVSSYFWNINGQSGSTQNDVYGEIRRDQTGPDSSLWSFSTTNARNGSGSVGVNRTWPTNYALFAQTRIVFDRNNASDPSCTATSGRV